MCLVFSDLCWGQERFTHLHKRLNGRGCGRVVVGVKSVLITSMMDVVG